VNADTRIFSHKVSSQFGEDWIHRLPVFLDRCQIKWQLTDCIPTDNLSINQVCYAQSDIYGDVVLKIEGPHDGRHTESTALQLFNGRHTCQLLAVDNEAAALLLE
jgi:hypothetical protein